MKIQPGTDLAQRPFYHGLCGASEAVVASIARDGLMPRNILDGKVGRGHLSPVANRVYLTQDLSYALIYAVGGCYVGRDPATLPEHTRRKIEGGQGYVFVSPGSRLADIQPDEDDVGQLLGYLHEREKLERSIAAYADDPRFQKILIAYRDAPDHIRYELSWLHDHLTTRQRDQLRRGYVSGHSSSGKRALKMMEPMLKNWFVKHGSHVANEGPLVPSEAWSFPYSRLADLRPDGSNFFEVAQKVSLTAPQTRTAVQPEPPEFDVHAYLPAAEESAEAELSTLSL